MDEPNRPLQRPLAADAARPGAPGTGGRSSVNDEFEEPPALERPEDAVRSEQEAPAGAAGASEPDYKDRWLRAEAELQNFRRRAARDWEEGRRLAEEGVLLEMVTVLDDLERALAAAEASGAASPWMEGVALVAQRIRDFLSRQGVTAEDPMGRPFDPAFHEALLELDAPDGAAPGSVVQVVHKGYRRGERALRAARVVVARGAAEGAL
jgi:molecular chaperone GrpE